MEKLLFFTICSVLLFTLHASAQEVPQKCEICNMDLNKYRSTMHIITLKDGSKKHLCGFADASRAIMKAGDENVVKVEAVDHSTGRIIDAQKASYVEGSKIKGVMSPISRLAFEEKGSAQKFTEKEGGMIVSFDDALKNQRDDDSRGMPKHKKPMNGGDGY